MNRPRRIALFAIVGGTIAFITGCGGRSSGVGEPTPVPGEFVRVDLGRTPAEYRHVAINASGQMALTRDIQRRYGFSFGQNGSTHYACLWNGTGWRNLHGPRGNASVAVDLNDQGQVLLFTLDEPAYYLPNGRPTGAFLYSDGTFTEIRPTDPDAGNVVPIQLGEDGSVIGSYTRQTETVHFLWRNGEMVTFPGYEVVGMNATGQVVLMNPEAVYPGEWAIQQPDGQRTIHSRLYPVYPNTLHFTPTGILDNGVVLGRFGDSAIFLSDGNITRAIDFLGGGRIAGSSHSGNTVINTVWMEFAKPLLRRSDGAVIDVDAYLPIVRTDEQSYKRLLHDINDQSQATGSYDARYSLSGTSVAYLLTPPALAPATGSATVKLSDVKNKSLDTSRFVATSVSGQLLAPNHLEAIVSTLTTSAGHRQFTVFLNLAQAIEAGKSYPMIPTEDNYLTGRNTGILYLGERPGAREILGSGSGSIIVDTITDQEITFRLVNIQVGTRRNDGTFNGPDFTLNATITVKR